MIMTSFIHKPRPSHSLTCTVKPISAYKYPPPYIYRTNVVTTASGHFVTILGYRKDIMAANSKMSARDVMGDVKDTKFQYFPS